MITILGGGISGLSCAYELSKHKIPFRLLEASDRVGGVIQSKRIDGYLLEFGANSTFNDEVLSSLCKDLGITPITANPVSKNRFVFKDNKIQVLPSGPLSLITSSFFSWKSKLSIFKELRHKPSSPVKDETVSQFFLRHFNQEIVDSVVDPFVGGIYAASPDTLTIAECFPKIADIEQEYGSVLKGFIKNKGSRREIISFKNGLQDLIDALFNRLKDNVILNEKITSITQKSDTNWTINTQHNQYESNYIINCLPPKASGTLFNTINPSFANDVHSIDSPAISMVHTVFKKSIFEEKLSGFGCLVPSKERKTIAGCIWNSSVFKYRCPEDEILLTNIIANNSSKNEDTLINSVIKDLERLFCLSDIKPVFTNVYNYKESIPQYNASIRKTRKHLSELENLNIYTATNWSKEVSVVGSIKNGIEVSKKIISLYSY